MSYTCYNCKREIKSGGHFYKCDKSDISKKEKKLKHTLFQVPEEFADKNKFKELYTENSLPDFYEKFEVQSNHVLFLVDYYGIEKRNIKSGAKFAEKKRKKTNLERYGSENVLGKESPIYEKRNETVKNKYGVDNIFQLSEIIEKIADSGSYVKRKEGFDKWQNEMSDTEKKEWLRKSIHSESAMKKSSKSRKRGRISKIEKKVINELKKLNYNANPQKYIHTGERFYIYDIFIEELNLLIEVNGTYWHADPKIYKANDLVNYPGGKVLASNIWKKDLEKKNFALNKGYNYMLIWESEIKNINTFLENRINEITEN